jgi:ribosomal protein S18 acetylase RimI-like enzyme/ElaB/YqjD/DUF883 family membrane-anchored ribosome-binding protein
MTALIRRAAVADLPAMLALYRRLNPDDPAADAIKPEEAWQKLLASPLVRIFVAETEGEIASSCTLVVVPNITRGARPYAFIENVVTDAGQRRRGLGRAVIAAALDAAWKADCYKVMLATGSQKPETLQFYERAGFVRGGKTFSRAAPQPDECDHAASSHLKTATGTIIRMVALSLSGWRGFLRDPSQHTRFISMPVVNDSDIAELSKELSILRAQIARIAEQLSETASHAGDGLIDEATAAGRRAWTKVQDEAEPYINGIEDHPIASTAFVFGALGLFLGLLFARRT